MRSPASWKRPKFPVSSADTTGWQLPDSIILRPSSSEPCPPSTYCSTTTSTKQLVSRTHLLRSYRYTASWSLPHPGGSHHYSIGIPVPVPCTSLFPVNKILAVILCLLIAYCMWVKSVPKTMTFPAFLPI
ncbi:hypothetical protein ILYODFUR_006658 [Ilyodon furcidens]|uniref:Uncharacterized protein n=1 Tax=Ilyodon furcidens TaxID=33524 RepID=A0ABV0TU84_9TELE